MKKNKLNIANKIAAQLFSIALVFVFLLSCNTSKSMLASGNYYQAVMQSVKKLGTSPNNKTAQEVLAQAYPMAIANYLDKIKNTKAIQSQFANSQSVYYYEDMNRLYEAIQHAPAAKKVITHPKKYYSEISEIKVLAAEEQYQAGLEQLALQTRENSKQAYFYFQDANAFVNNYKDVNQLIQQAYSASILKVLVDLQPVQSRQYDLSAEVFYSQVKKSLRQIEQNEFIQFFSKEDAEKNNVSKPNQYLTINFDDFVVGNSHEKVKVEKMRSDSVKVGQVTLEDNTKKDVYGVVHAKVDIHRLEVVSSGLVRLQISEPQFEDKFLVEEDFIGDFIWFNEWGSFKGDKRALTPKQIEICRGKYIPPIPPQQMFVEFTRPIQANIHDKLISFYKGY